MFASDQTQQVYNLDPEDPDNDVEQFGRDQEYISTTVDLGDGSVYAVLEEPNEYVERARKGVKALKMVDAVDRGSFRDIYENAVSDQKRGSSRGAREIAAAIQEQLSGDDRDEENGRSVVQMLAGDAPDHIFADALETYTPLGRYVRG